MPHGQDVVERLGQLTLFADLSRPQHEALAHTYEEELFSEGQRVLRQGFSGSNLYVILDGEASVAIDGSERTRLGRGDFFGEVSALLEEPPTADVVAAGPLRCLVIGPSQLTEMLLRTPEVAVRMLKSECRRLRSALGWRA